MGTINGPAAGAGPGGRSAAADGDPSARRAWHVAVVVENVPIGDDHRLRKQVETMIGAGFRVSVVTMRHPDNAPYRDLDGLRLLEYPPPPEGHGVAGFAREYTVSFLWASWLLARLRLRSRVDVVQLCQPPDVYFPTAWLMRWAGARIVVDQRDLMPETLAARNGRDAGQVGGGVMMTLLRWLERRSQRVAHRTVTVNGYLRDRLEGAGARDVVVVMNGPVLARARRARPDPELRAGAEHLVVWVGKIGPQDSVDTVVRLAEEVVLRRGRTDCRFVVLGDGEGLADLVALTGDLGLRDWVSFAGWVDEATVFAHLATADLGLDTSHQVEVSPVKAMEYMAQGLPFVCFDLQETRLLASGAAELVPVGDLGRFTDAVLGLLDDPERRRRLGAHGRERIEHELAWEHQASRYLRAVAPPDVTGSAHALPVVPIVSSSS